MGVSLGGLGVRITAASVSHAKRRTVSVTKSVIQIAMYLVAIASVVFVRFVTHQPIPVNVIQIVYPLSVEVTELAISHAGLV